MADAFGTLADWPCATQPPSPTHNPLHGCAFAGATPEDTRQRLLASLPSAELRAVNHKLNETLEWLHAVYYLHPELVAYVNDFLAHHRPCASCGRTLASQKHQHCRVYIVCTQRE